LVSDTKLISASEEHDRSDYVQIMAHAKWEASGKSTGIAIARRGGSLQILDPVTGQVVINRVDERVEPDDMFVALEETHGHLFWCTNHGYFGFVPLASWAKSIEVNGSSDPEKIVGLTDFKLEGPISKARCHPRFVGVFAFGGKDVNLEIWSSTSQGSSNYLKSFFPSWSAKNVRNDEYNLKQPVWVSDLQFLDEQLRAPDLGFLVAICTRFHQVRVYDTRLSRRPIVNIEIGSSPLVSMVLGASDSEVIFADSHGKVTSFSLDKCVSNGNFAGPTGSVLSLDVHRPAGEAGILACVGLDRFLRLFDMSTRASIGKIYCKTKMTSVLIVDGLLGSPAPPVSPPKRKKAKDGSTHKAEDDESDSVWAKLPEIASVGGSNVKRRRVHV